MKNFYRLVFVFLMALSASAFGADTLEVFAIRVQFAEEIPDNSLTTGTGLFDSDKSKKSDYKLDPSGRRNSVPYWKKHFDFANAYFNKASNGNLVVKARIFPEASSAYKLKKQIIDYNRTSKMKGEKNAEFDDARSRDYLQFVYDAVTTAHESGESPFNIPLSKNPQTKRAYMIIHAGASRLVDGGSMGTRNADTPGDFMDVYIDGESWSYLPDSLEYTAVEKVDGDSAKVNGLVLKGAAIDTLRSVMVMSETASQDGLNWGVNGILVNQIGRELGLPNTYDVVKGISRLGYFDVMDFAGYNAGNGFLPSMPGAWSRAYMGWSKVKEVRPVAGKPVTVEVAAAGLGLGDEIIKVPLSGSEYLLIENRQRSWSKDGSVSVTLGDPDESSDTLIKTVAVDSLNLVFEDSVCVNGKCSVNKKKASGIITDVSSFDAGLPASGIVVWRVNDWYLRETLQYGVANFWGGDTLRDHQFGLAMVEADGILSIGKTFKNALGEDTYDYGSGTDLLPHLRIPEKNATQKFDTVKTIGSTGYANTKTTQGGYTGIKISVSVPKDARLEKTSNGFMGDSVVNFASQVLMVTISIDDGSIEGSEFPRNVGIEGAVRGIVFVEDPDHDGEKLLVVGGKDGTLQAFSALGDTLYDADTVVTQKKISRKDSVAEVPLYRMGPSVGKMLGMASDGKYVYSLHEKVLRRSYLMSGMIPQGSELKVDAPVAGPMIFGNRVWVVTETGLKSAWLDKEGKFSWQSGLSVENFEPEDMAACSSKDWNGVIVVGKHGDWFSYEMESGSLDMHKNSLNGEESFRIACADFNRDDKLEVVGVGSRGTTFAQTLEGKSIWNGKIYKRGAAGGSGLKDEISGIALGDVNGNGYPEVVFLGDNMVYALDRFGLPISGFPVKISRGAPIHGFFSDPILVDVTGDNIPEILVPSSDGLVYAYTGKGKAVTEGFPMAAGSFEYADSISALQPMSIFVADAISKSNESQLYALHRHHLSAFRLHKADPKAAQSPLAWALPAGGNERTSFFDASKLKAVGFKKAKDEISEFFMFPNPVRGGVAKARFEIGAKAKSATLELFDITGLCVFKTKMSEPMGGRNQFENLDLKNLGSDIYTAKLTVKFESGKTKQKLYRVGVVR